MHLIAPVTKKIIEVSPAKQQHRLRLTIFNKKDPGGRVRQPSEKVRQAMHE